MEKLAALVPLPRVHLVRYGGCVALHSRRRGALTPTPRQQGVDGPEANTGTPRWNWARLLRRGFDLAMATCPLCRRGARRIIAALTQASVLTRLLRHRTLASVPPPIAPARSRHATCDWVASAHDVAPGLVSDVRTVEVCFPPLSVCNPVCIYPPPQPPFPRPAPQAPLLALLSPSLSGLSRRRCTALCLAPGRVDGAAAPRWARGRSRGASGAVATPWDACGSLAQSLLA